MMRKINFIKAQFAVISLIVLTFFPLIAGGAERRGEAGVFDFYVLSLSWSPTFCHTTFRADIQDQCDPDRDLGFIVHGLWPQYVDGNWPAFCDSPFGRRLMDFDIFKDYMDLIPSRSLISHVWAKHGTCTGLSQRAYFETLRSLAEKINIPKLFMKPQRGFKISQEEILFAFQTENPGLGEDSAVVSCYSNNVDEIRVCFEKDGRFRTCTGLARNCKIKSLNVLPVP